MTKKQRPKRVSQGQYEEQFLEQVARAETMIVATLLFPEICGIDAEHLPLFERAHDAVGKAAHELAHSIIVAEQEEIEAEELAAKGKSSTKAGKIQTAFDSMTEVKHEAMKAKLLRLAKAGRPRPAPDTLEGYCLAAYTDDGRIAVPGII